MKFHRRRTTQNALLMLNRFADGRRSTTTMAVDLLLRHEDGAVIIGEVKVAKAKAYDTDSVLALVQALAAATQFSTPPQQARLTRFTGSRRARSGESSRCRCRGLRRRRRLPQHWRVACECDD